MSYYQLLDLKEEPFSNSPAPEFFFLSRKHQDCAQQLELAIRLKRGLNLVIGPVGTGKTTLCRFLYARLCRDTDLQVHLIPDPVFDSEAAFLTHVATLMGVATGHSGPRMLREAIRSSLFHQGVDANRLVVLMIDEAQKLPGWALEILREFLNFETNAHKLLQIVLFGQPEFLQSPPENLLDRVNLMYRLEGLDFRDTCGLVRHRLRVAGGEGAMGLFGFLALLTVYRMSGGYPRRIIHLCHRTLLALLVSGGRKVGRRAVLRAAHRIPEKAGVTTVSGKPGGWVPLLTGLMALGIFWGMPEKLQPDFHSASENQAVPVLEERKASGTDLAESAIPVVPPEQLGRIRVRPGDVFSALTCRVYGSCLPEEMAAVLAENKHLKNANHIRPGDEIVFPVLRTFSSAGPVLVVRETAVLEEAVRTIRQGDAGFPLRLVPVWNAARGMHFFVVLEGCMPDGNEALSFLKAARKRFGDFVYPLEDWSGFDRVYAGFGRGCRKNNGVKSVKPIENSSEDAMGLPEETGSQIEGIE